MKRPTAIYARVSSDRQKEAGTIGSQTTLLREYAEAHDLQVPAEWVFEDEGYTGATLARPGLERLRDLERVLKMGVSALTLTLYQERTCYKWGGCKRIRLIIQRI
jgi:site-specific DNA recombinase